MQEKKDVNMRIIKAVKKGEHPKHLKNLIVTLFREEFSNKEKKKWKYSEFYETKIKMCLDEVDNAI